MSLYYELDPADDNDPPLLPPILTPVAVPDKIEVFNKAISAASNSEAGDSILFREYRICRNSCSFKSRSKKD